MPKNLLDVLKGTVGGGGGIKGDWDCTPVIGADFNVVDSYRATYNAETKIASADWSGISTVTPGTPYVGMLKTDLTLGSISLNEVKKLSLQITADLADPTAMVYLGAFFLDSNTYTAEDAANLLFDFMMLATPLPRPNFYLVGVSGPINNNNSVGASSAFSAVTDDYPSGMMPVSNTVGGDSFDTSAVGAGDNISLFISKTAAAAPATGEVINFTSAIFDSTGTMLTVGQLAELPGNPVINSEMTMYIGFLTMIQSGSVLPPASVGADVTAGPNTATLSEITFTSGSLQFTQDDWDLVYPSPATPFIPVNQAVFPQGAKKNDQFRVKIQAPATQATPYGTVVTPESVVVVDNVNAGQEAFRVLVDSSVLEARLAQLDFSTQIGSLTALVDEAGRRSGEMVFYVRSADPALDPLVGPGIYDSFELAYEAAILQPRHIRKYIVIDDRSLSYRPTIPFKTSGDGTWYLAGNNIELSTVRTFDRIVDPGQVPSGSYPYYFNEVVDVRGRFDALHFCGGAWAIAHGRDYNSYDCFCVPSSPSTMVETPSGMRRALEMGDNTNVMLSPLSYNLNWWDESVLHVGNNCTLMIFTDVRQTAMYADSGVMQAFPYIYNYDGYHATPGLVTGKNGMTTIYAGTNFCFQIGYGSPENGVAAFPLTIQTPARHEFIDFGVLTGCQHLIDGQTAVPVFDAQTEIEKVRATLLQTYGREVREINTKADLIAESNIGSDGFGNTLYHLNGNFVYYFTGIITLNSNEIISAGNNARYYGSDPEVAGIIGTGANGWLTFGNVGTTTFENMLLHVESNGSIFREHSTDFNQRVVFKMCQFKKVGDLGHNYIPAGQSSKVEYIDCYTTMTGTTNPIVPPSTTQSNVRFERHTFNEQSNQFPTTTTVFDLVGRLVAGRLVFKNCHVTTISATAGAEKRTLLRITATGGPIATITQSAGIVVDNCTKSWDDNTWNNNQVILGGFRDVPNLVFADINDPVPTIRGKRVVNVYDELDWPDRANASAYVHLKANTIYRIHSNIVVQGTMHFLAQGTEIEGVTGPSVNSISFGTSTSSALPDLVCCGDDWAISNIKLINTSSVIDAISICISPNGDYAGYGQPYYWYNNKPIKVSNIEFVFQGGEVSKYPILFKRSLNSSLTPDIEIGNLIVSQITHNCVFNGGGFNNYLKNITIRDVTREPLINGKRQTGLIFGPSYWNGEVTIRDSELAESPIFIDAGGVAALTAANRVTAFNNRGVTSAGVYNNALSTYVDGILMSNATLMLAQGNILGAPNSP